MKVMTRARLIPTIAAQRGALSVTTLLVLMLILIPLGAFFVETSRIYALRNQVQNGADAAAQFGAADLLPPSANGIPNWSKAETSASNALRYNTIAGKTLYSQAAPTLYSGYWNLNTHQFETGQDKNVAFPIKDGSGNPRLELVPALQITVPIPPVDFMLKGLIWLGGGSVTSMPVTARGIGVSGTPVSQPSAKLGYYAISKCVFDQYWNYDTAAPKEICGPGSSNKSVCAFQLGSLLSCASNVPGCLCGQLMNPATQSADPILVGSKITLEAGANTSWYNSKSSGKFPDNTDVVLAVIDEKQCNPFSLNANSVCPVISFACFHIDHSAATGGCSPSDKPTLKLLYSDPSTKVALSDWLLDTSDYQNKCFIGYLQKADTCGTTGGAGGGYYYGISTPPQLVPTYSY